MAMAVSSVSMIVMFTRPNACAPAHGLREGNMPNTKATRVEGRVQRVVARGNVGRYLNGFGVLSKEFPLTHTTPTPTHPHTQYNEYFGHRLPH